MKAKLSTLAPEIQEGYKARLDCVPFAECPYLPADSTPAEQWRYGWRMADRIKLKVKWERIK